MSGVEIAGLVLAVIPVITAALGELDKTTDKVTRFRSWRRDCPSFISRLNAQRIRLLLSLRLLFQLTDLPELDLDDIHKHDCETLWNRDDIVQALKKAHGEIYDAVESDVLQIRALIQQLCEKLGLDKIVETSDLSKAWTQLRTTSGSKDSFRQRWSYTQSGRFIDTILSQIDSRQQSIRGTLGDIESVMRHRRKSQAGMLATKDIAEVLMVQQDVSMLYTVLEKVLRCQLHHGHSVQLVLDHVPELRLDDIPKLAHSCFSLGISSPSAAPFKSAEIHVLRDDETFASLPTRYPPPSQILNMCSAMEDDYSDYPGLADHLGFQINSSDGKEPDLSGVFCPLGLRTWKADTSLHQLLEEHPAYLRLDEKNLRYLAPRLALYALQLQATPWARTEWNSQDVFLDLWRRPSIIKTIDRDAQVAPRDRRQFFLSLAVIIMELCLG